MRIYIKITHTHTHIHIYQYTTEEIRTRRSVREKPLPVHVRVGWRKKLVNRAQYSLYNIINGDVIYCNNIISTIYHPPDFLRVETNENTARGGVGGGRWNRAKNRCDLNRLLRKRRGPSSWHCSYV